LAPIEAEAIVTSKTRKVSKPKEKKARLVNALGRIDPVAFPVAANILNWLTLLSVSKNQNQVS
jgi:hypothetical protein